MDSSDEETLVRTSKQLGEQRFRQRQSTVSNSKAPLVIPTQPNPDWREAARRRRAACSRVQPHISRVAPSFVPDSALAATGADGSVGGLGTRDTINSGPQLSGLHINKRLKVDTEEDGVTTVDVVSVDQSAAEVVEETEDQRALRAILAGEDGSASLVEIIPVRPLSETDALKQDMQELPDIATADDYERVPISAFGAAMLRGMGWTDGAVASRLDKKRKTGLTELYLPQARPALLGIGAKEREPDDDGSGKKKPRGQDMRYIPVARKERSRDRGDESRQRTRDYDERTRERKDRRDWDTDSRGRGDPYREREREGKGKGRQYDQRDRPERDRWDRRGDR